MAVWLDIVNAMAALRTQVAVLTDNVQVLYGHNSDLRAKIVALETQIAAQAPGGPTPADMQTMANSMVATLGNVIDATNSVVAIAASSVP